MNAPDLAKQRGVQILEQKKSKSHGFTNLITVSIETSRSEKSASGTLLNGLGPRIVKVDQYSIDLNPKGHILLVQHRDQPGVIGQVGTVLGNHQINIATMQVGRETIGGQAIMMIRIDKSASNHVLKQLREINVIDAITDIDL